VRKLRNQSVRRPDPAHAVAPRGPDALDRLIERVGPEAVCAALTPALTDERPGRIDEVLAARLISVIPVVEDVYEPINGAAVIRTAEALGLQELHVIEPGLRFQAARGITRGCDRWIDVRRWSDAAGCVAGLRAQGVQVFATSPDATTTIDAIDVARPCAIVFGNEHAGLPAATVAACDGAVALPMWGFTRSFNLSVSAALVLSQLAARRRAHLGRAGDLPDDRRRHLRARWFALKVRGAVGIVERAVSGETRTDVAPGPQPRDNC
jgi:tRNA (guanosine-2'-O-)-methyltransferase